MPSAFPQLDFEVAQILGMSIGLVVVGIAWRYFSEKEKVVQRRTEFE